jgi:hypothetical protein
MSNIADKKLDATSRDDQKMHPRKKKSPFLAIILSLFIPGLGNVYTGQVNLGIVTFVGFIVCGAIVSFSHDSDPSSVSLIFFFLLLTIVFWLTSMAFAYGTAVKINDGEYVHDIAFFPKRSVSKP